MAERIGERLGNYRLVRLLGSGGFADVYLAQQVYLNTLVAIKVLTTHLTPETMENFLTEARQLSRLDHPHILRVLDFGLAQDRPYLVMEYAPGGTLRQRHPGGSRVPLQAIVSYITDIAPALQWSQTHQRKARLLSASFQYRRTAPAPWRVTPRRRLRTGSCRAS